MSGTNIHILTLADRNRSLPLRGNMAGVNMNFTPPDNQFMSHLYTEDAGQYTLTSAHKFFVNGQVATSFTFGGKAGLFAQFKYDIVRATWVLESHNLFAAEAPAPIDQVDTISQATIDAIIARLMPDGGATGQFLVKTGNGDYEADWGNAPVSTNTGSGPAPFVAEVLLTQDANGNVTPNKALGNNFRVLITRNGKFLAPVGYANGEEVNITTRMDVSGPFVMDWDLAYGQVDRQVPKLSNRPFGVNWIKIHSTAAIGAAHAALWKTEVWPKGAIIGYGAPAFIARNVNRSIGYYVLRSPTMLSGMTDMQNGETLKIVRDGLGVEAYGALDQPGTFLVSGALPDGSRAELRTGPGIRTAFDKGIISVGGNAVATIQDLILNEAREQSGSSRIAAGLNLTGNATVVAKNVRIVNCENGVNSGNTDFTGSLTLIDCELDACGVGDDGLTHNIYTGRHPQGVTLIRTSSINCFTAHNLKHRDGSVTLRQVLARNARNGRELNLPNGSNLNAENCIFHKTAGSSTGQLIGIGEEGIELSRPHGYIFRNCRFQNDNSASGNDVTFVINFDHVPMYFIDCEFIGPANGVQADPNGDAQFNGMVTVNGIRYYPDSPPVFVRTSPDAPLGPILPVGYQSIAVTQL